MNILGLLTEASWAWSIVRTTSLRPQSYQKRLFHYLTRLKACFTIWGPSVSYGVAAYINKLFKSLIGSSFPVAKTNKTSRLISSACSALANTESGDEHVMAAVQVLQNKKTQHWKPLTALYRSYILGIKFCHIFHHNPYKHALLGTFQSSYRLKYQLKK